MGMTEAEIIVKMRGALDLLKQKYQELEGGRILTEFVSAALDNDHWMNRIVEAEDLSDPYMPSAPQETESVQ